jgi:hypothetical protein
MRRSREHKRDGTVLLRNEVELVRLCYLIDLTVTLGLSKYEIEYLNIINRKV